MNRHQKEENPDIRHEEEKGKKRHKTFLEETDSDYDSPRGHSLSTVRQLQLNTTCTSTCNGLIRRNSIRE